MLGVLERRQVDGQAVHGVYSVDVVAVYSDGYKLKDLYIVVMPTQTPFLFVDRWKRKIQIRRPGLVASTGAPATPAR